MEIRTNELYKLGYEILIKIQINLKVDDKLFYFKIIKFEVYLRRNRSNMKMPNRKENLNY